MKNLFYVLVIVITVISACEPEEEIVTSGNIEPLLFSTDTIFFDTVLTQTGSLTKRLVVENPNKNAISISSIKVGMESNSSYNLYVNGISGKEFSNHVILGRDSLLILIEVFIDQQNNDLPFLVKDSISFTTNSTIQDVKLISYGQDANFINGAILACNTVWDSPKPYVITNSVLVDTLCQLTIMPGVRVLSDNNSRFIVAGSLQVDGTVEDPVLFSGLRFDEEFADAPGQWGGILFLPVSDNNHIFNATIQNGVNGIESYMEDENDDPDLVLENLIIENMNNNGIIAFESDISGSNLLVNNCLNQLIAHAGGKLEYFHCTFTNEGTSFSRRRDVPSVVFVDSYEVDELPVITSFDLSMVNSILWGNNMEELLISLVENSTSEIFVANSLIRTSIDLDINDNILNVDPDFVNPREDDFSLFENSPAINAGLATSIFTDLLGRARDENPDLGAFEYFNEE